MAAVDEARTVPLGDALQRVVARIYTDTLRLLQDLKGLDPELRTTELRNFLSHNKAKLLQMLCIVRWLEKPNITQLFRSMAQYKMEIGMVEGVLARNMDEMYFIHGSLFPLRSSKHECSLARRILADGSYPALPLAVTTAGRKPLPEDLPIADLHRQLELFIRAKLALVDPWPVPSPYEARIHHGQLHISRRHLFELHLTLSHLSPSAPWSVVSFHCLRPPSSSPPGGGGGGAADVALLGSIQPLVASLPSLLQACDHAAHRVRLRCLYDRLRGKKSSSAAAAAMSYSAVRYLEHRGESSLVVDYWPAEGAEGRPALVCLQVACPPPPSSTQAGWAAVRVRLVVLPSEEECGVQAEGLDSLLGREDAGEATVRLHVPAALAALRCSLLARLTRPCPGLHTRLSPGGGGLSLSLAEEEGEGEGEGQGEGRACLAGSVDLASGRLVLDCSAGLARVAAVHAAEVTRLAAAWAGLDSLSALQTALLSTSPLLPQEEGKEGGGGAMACGLARLLLGSEEMMRGMAAAGLALASPVEHAAVYADLRRRRPASPAYTLALARLAFADAQDARPRPQTQTQTQTQTQNARSLDTQISRPLDPERRVDLAPSGSRKRPRPGSGSGQGGQGGGRGLRAWYVEAVLEEDGAVAASLLTARLQASFFSKTPRLQPGASPVQRCPLGSWPAGALYCPRRRACLLSSVLHLLARTSSSSAAWELDLYAAPAIRTTLPLPPGVEAKGEGSRLVVTARLLSQGLGEEEAVEWRLRRYVRAVSTTRLHSWALDGCSLPGQGQGRASGVLREALARLADAFCASSEEEGEATAAALVCMLAVLRLATAATPRLRARPVAAVAGDAASPLDLLLALQETDAGDNNNRDARGGNNSGRGGGGGQGRLRGYVRVSVHSRLLRAGYAQADQLVVRDLRGNVVVAVSPQEVSRDRLAGLLQRLVHAVDRRSAGADPARHD